MSYTEYMRRKDAVAIKLKDTRQNTDASMYITKVRMAASQVFPVDGARVGAVNSGDYSSMAPSHQVMSYKKVNGGAVRDASTYSAYRGGQAIGKSVQSGEKPAQVNVGTCYSIDSTAPAQSVSDFVRQTQGCKVSLGQPHFAGTVDMPKFVDNTIRNLGDPSLCTTPIPNHGVKAEVHHNLHPARPVPSAKGNLEPGKDAGALGGNDHYKPGAALRKIPHVEKHHGNDLGVNPKRPFVKYQIPAGTPAHLKINDPTQVKLQ